VPFEALRAALGLRVGVEGGPFGYCELAAASHSR
jgi:hypothetical protein